MTRFLRITIALIIMICADSFSICSQVSETNSATDSSSAATVFSARKSDNRSDAPYTQRKGDNEWGFWGGGTFKATTIFGGLSDAEASDLKFFLGAFRYGRTLAANESLALQYTLDAVPLAVATGNIVSSTTVGPVMAFQRETAYGGGLTPLGLQLDFANGSRVHPFVHVNGGGLIFDKPVPLPDAGKFAFVGEAGTGVRFFPRRSAQ